MKKIALAGLVALAGCGSTPVYEQPQAKRVYFSNDGTPLSHGPAVENETPFERIAEPGETVESLRQALDNERKELAAHKKAQADAKTASLLGKDPQSWMSGKKPAATYKQVTVEGTFEFGENYDMLASAWAAQKIVPGSVESVRVASQLSDENSLVGYLRKHTPFALVETKRTGFSYGMNMPVVAKEHATVAELVKRNPAEAYAFLKERNIKQVTEQVLGDLEKRLEK